MAFSRIQRMNKNKFFVGRSSLCK